MLTINIVGIEYCTDKFSQQVPNNQKYMKRKYLILSLLFHVSGCILNARDFSVEFARIMTCRFGALSVAVSEDMNDYAYGISKIDCADVTLKDSAERGRTEITAVDKQTVGSYDDEVNWTFDKKTRKLFIASKSDRYDFVIQIDDAPWCDYRTDIKSVEISPSIKRINKDAFKGCVSLSSIKIPNSVMIIEAEAFSGCNALPVENGIMYADKWAVGVVGSHKWAETYVLNENTIGLAGTFAGCIMLHSIALPDGLMYISDRAFDGCARITNISIPQSVIDIQPTSFKGCIGLPVKKGIRYADKWAIGVVDNTSKRYKLQENTIGLVGTFAYCPNLKSIDIPFGVRIIGDDTFSDCTSLTEVNVPSSVEFIGDYAFCNCQRLKVKIVEGVLYYDIPSTNLLVYANIPASFPGGNAKCMKWLSKNLEYPAFCEAQGIGGRVVLSFVIDKDGSIEDIKVKESPNEDLTMAAVRAVKSMPKWKPAFVKGRVDRTRFVLPIQFGFYWMTSSSYSH